MVSKYFPNGLGLKTCNRYADQPGAVGIGKLGPHKTAIPTFLGPVGDPSSRQITEKGKHGWPGKEVDPGMTADLLQRQQEHQDKQQQKQQQQTSSEQQKQRQ